jgi:hypothetical protein
MGHDTLGRPRPIEPLAWPVWSEVRACPCQELCHTRRLKPSSGNAPTSFAGSASSTGKRGQGRGQNEQDHTHTAVLSGLERQELQISRSGAGGHKQLVFDDTV